MSLLLEVVSDRIVALAGIRIDVSHNPGKLTLKRCNLPGRIEFTRRPNPIALRIRPDTRA